MERTSVFDTIKFRPGFGFFCFLQITVFQYFRDNSTIKDFKIPLFFQRMKIYWFFRFRWRGPLTQLQIVKRCKMVFKYVLRIAASGVTPVCPIEPCLDKHHQASIFLFDATIMIYHVSLQTCFKMYNGVWQGWKRSRPRSTPLVWEILINCQWNAVGRIKRVSNGMSERGWIETKDKWSLTANPFQVSEILRWQKINWKITIDFLQNKW